MWSLHGERAGDTVAVRERSAWPSAIGFGVQHLAVTLGAAIVVPAATGLPVGATLLFSGIGTLLFLVVTRNRVPAVMAPSFAFVAPLSASAHHDTAAKLGSVLAAGLILVVVGIAVKALGARLLESLMPPIVAGSVIVLIGLSAAPSAAAVAQRQPMVAALTAGAVLIAVACTRGPIARLSVLAAMALGTMLAAAGGGIDRARLDALIAADWVGLPQFHTPSIRSSAVLLVVPVVLVLVAETVGHVKAIAATTGRNLDGSAGDALIAGGLGASLAGAGGGASPATSGANIGVMAVSRAFSIAACAAAGVFTIALAFSPKAVALLACVPAGVVGAVALLLFGALAMIGVRMWPHTGTTLTEPANALVVAVAVMAGVGNLTVPLAGMQVPGVVWGSAAIVLGYPVVRRLTARRDARRATG
ncbi:xanthine/uracil permease [Herbihabitans rhizosphaerae]|uniref:Xanthine/uracil permease n=1 Tax=Herbihabitans rhizosphaerae TaxID=1872711 RepID=A0A4Q7KLF8_9PSEU|nr:solute carrier family 23 protein [Herbihabitans rhizosphaerae]RZS34776.1 xanthine/uracil permease [Herbihabitans rhizosphaerae]